MAKTFVKLILTDNKEGNADANSYSREVLHVSYEFDQPTDVEGQITGSPAGGIISIRVKALNIGDTTLLDWMLNPKLAYSGNIVFTESATGQVEKVITFGHGYCIDYHENWTDNQMHYEEISITCKSFEIKGFVDFKNEWAY